VARARTKPDDRVEEAMKALRDIEAAKEARTRLEQQELADLEEKTSSIIKQMDEMIKSKEAALNEIDSIGAEERRRRLEAPAWNAGSYPWPIQSLAVSADRQRLDRVDRGETPTEGELAGWPDGD